MDRRWADASARAAALLRGDAGQSTLEYALVLLGLMGMLAGLAALWRAAQDNRLLELARDAASHSLSQGVDVKVLQDVTAF